MLEMRSSLRTIDSKLDVFTSQLESVKQKVDTHETRLDVLENRHSDLHDFQVETKEQVLQMDKVLGLLRAKNEDLEARSRRNNLRITGIAETTAINKMETPIPRLCN